MPLTFDEAISHTSPNAEDYGLPTDASAEQVNQARATAAQKLIDGTTANDVYWNSRGQLEQLLARVQGHGQVSSVYADESTSPTAAVSPTADAEATAAEEPQTTAPAVGPGESTPSTPVPLPDNPADAIARLRRQVEESGGTPVA